MEENGHTPLTGVVETRPSTLAPVSQPAEDAWQRDWGLFLRLARQVAGLSLTELADRSGLSKGYLSKLESGSAGARNPSRATLAALARALPSFRTLAHMLDPGLAPTPLAPTLPPTGVPIGLPSSSTRDATPHLIDEAASTRSMPSNTTVTMGGGEKHEPDDAPPAPLRLGWRELEVVLVLLALDRAALPTPITALAIARALDRPLGEVRPVLDQLLAAGVLLCETAPRPNGPLTYMPSPHLPRRLGISRVGDALVLAAALLAGASSQWQRTMRPRGGDA